MKMKMTHRLLIIALSIFVLSLPARGIAKTYSWDDYSEPFEREVRISSAVEIKIDLPAEIIESYERLPLTVSYRRPHSEFYLSLRVNNQPRSSKTVIAKTRDRYATAGSETVQIDRKYLRAGQNTLRFSYEGSPGSGFWYVDITALKLDLDGSEIESTSVAKKLSENKYRWSDYSRPFEREIRLTNSIEVEVDLSKEIIDKNEQIPLSVGYRRKTRDFFISLRVNDQSKWKPYKIGGKADSPSISGSETILIDNKFFKPGTNILAFEFETKSTSMWYLDITSIKFDFEEMENSSLLASEKTPGHQTQTPKEEITPYNYRPEPAVKKPQPETKEHVESAHSLQRSAAGVRWAVVIGVSDYKDSRIPSLRYANKDARSFYDWLVSPKGGRYALSRVKLLVDNNATGIGIRNSLFEWLGQALEEDVVTIFFAGHGSPQSPDNPENLFLLPYDTNYDSVATTGFPMWDIETAFKRFIRAKKVIVIADACHAGGVGQAFDVARRAGRGMNTVTISSNLQNLSRIGDGICIISASDDSQFSQESKKWGGGHGVFTYYLLRGLKGEADYSKDRKVTLGEIVPYLSEQVRRATRNAQSPTVAGRFDPALTIGK